MVQNSDRVMGSSAFHHVLVFAEKDVSCSLISLSIPCRYLYRIIAPSGL